MLSMMANMIFRMAAVNSGWVFQPTKSSFGMLNTFT